MESIESRSAVCIFVGMAGSGKTTLVERFSSHLRSGGQAPYVLNLDPAAQNTPYEANIDIRDTVNYKAVMKEYGLGPNGAILTSSNLFATRFDRVIDILKERINDHRYILIDTPGQIEMFTWSASGMMITEMLSSTFATYIFYILDTSHCQRPQALVSNLLQAVSVLYRIQLPLVLIFNKIDIVPYEPLVKQLFDASLLHAELDRIGDYSSALTSSLNTILQEFYQQLNIVGVSAALGTGLDDLMYSIENQ